MLARGRHARSWSTCSLRASRDISPLGAEHIMEREFGTSWPIRRHSTNSVASETVHVRKVRLREQGALRTMQYLICLLGPRCC